MSLRIDSIQRGLPVTIRVNGEPIQAFPGETLLAALIAAGIRALRKSPVREEPRGGFCGMGVCRECQVTVNGTPNIRACMVKVEAGMEVELHV